MTADADNDNIMTTQDMRSRVGKLIGTVDYLKYPEPNPVNLAMYMFDEWLAEERRRVSEEVWAEAYAQGIEDERTAEALQVDIGLGPGTYAQANRSNPHTKR